MKIAVLSDSHYEASSINAIKKYLVDVDVILHCGDGAPDTKILLNDFKSNKNTNTLKVGALGIGREIHMNGKDRSNQLP
mgnify:CR=1 FL=1